MNSGPMLGAASAAGVVVAWAWAGGRRARRRGSGPGVSSASPERAAVSDPEPQGVARGVPPMLLVAVASVVLLLAGAVLGPVTVPVVGGAVLVARARFVRRRRRRQLAVLDRALPEVVDLFLVAAAAGLPVAGCLRAVAERAPPPARPPLAGAVAHVARGAPLAAALQRLGPAIGTLGPSLTDVLIGAHRSGAPLLPRLRDVADATRDARRRSAEEAARRLPVTLLFPLVCCVLPAFGLLAVVPLLVASLSSLRP